MNEISANDVLQFWFEDIEPIRWFRKNPKFDKELEQRFGDLLMLAGNGELDHWCDTPHGTLALIVVLDQFSRNIYRGSPRAFDADPRALQLTVDGIRMGVDEKLSLQQRLFFYLPLQHAENLEIQELGLSKTRELADAGYGTDKHALNHLVLIERFGRFPHRNNVLRRRNTEEEESYLREGNSGF